ncbi:RNA-directed DNA polymerase from mobile element jockey [Trichonephila clavipes]|nr:RNA-directed DNA polymerase from mobile element jockey [Trichonephila clavipes]
MTQRTAPWENWHLERGFELLRTFGLGKPCQTGPLKITRDSPPPFSNKKPNKINPNREKTQNASIKTPILPYPTHDDQAIDSLHPCPDKEPMLPRPNVNEIAANSRFLILSLTNNDMSKKSPFAIHKALIGIGGEPKSVKRLRSGDLLIETNSALQTKSFLLAKSFLDSPITISPHKTLNSCRGVISESDLLTTPDAEILDGFSDQGVIQPKRNPPSLQKHLQHRILSHQLACLSKTKGKIKEQPSQLHRPRKDSKPIDLLSIKPTPNLKKNPAKNTTLKTAREQDSPNDSTPVSKRSRRRKTSKTSDAMDTDANPSDSDCVIDDVKDIIRQYHPVCVALQETFLKSCHTTKIRRYGCVRKDTEGPSVSGGVCIFTSLDVPSSALPFHTSLQAVAVRIHSTSLITVCCLYLPPNTVIHQHDLNSLVDQLPAPFIILGDFNGHSTLWGSAKTNPRGRQIEQVLSDHCLCLLNHEEPTYVHEPTRSFHTLDLAICSPSLLPHLNLSVEKDLYNSDHLPVILSQDSDTDRKTFPPTYSDRRADWALFTQLAVITDAMVKTESVDTAVQEVTNVLITATELSIPKVSSHSFQRYKPWWNTDCQTAYKNQRKLWGIFRRYPTTENLLAFKKAKANARRVRRRSQRQSWIRYVSSLTSSTSSKQLWKKVKAANGIYREFSFPILQTSNSVFSSPEEIVNILGETFQSVSSAASYNSRFLEIKRRAERTR